MNWVRKGFVQLFAVILLISLLGLSVSLALNQNLGRPEPVKSWLAESKIYDNLVSDLISDAAKTDSERAALYNSQAVLQLADRTFTKDLVSQSVGTIVDSNYAWLRGSTPTPNFSIDLTKQREAFAAQVGNYVQIRLSTLPACTATELTQLQLPVDPLTIQCRPATINATTEGNRVSREILASSFLSNPVITATTLGQEGAQPYYADLTQLPRAYQTTQKLPIVFGVTALLSIVAILLVAVTRRKGIRRIGATFVATGLILIIGKFASASALTTVKTRSVEQQGIEGVMRQPYVDLIDRAGAAIMQDILFAGIACMALGFIAIIYLLATRQRQHTAPAAAPLRQQEPARQQAATKPLPVAPQAPVTPPMQTQPAAKRPQALDIMAPAKTQQPTQKPITPGTAPAIKRQPKPRRPRLIQ
jgi:hypothetical protein